MARFALTIDLGADQMTTPPDVAEALIRLASRFASRETFAGVEQGVIRTLAGETVGLFQIEEAGA